MDYDRVLLQIDELEELLLECRSVFPVLSEGHIGLKRFDTAPYYMHQGYAAQVNLTQSITAAFVERHNLIAQWINENAIIRLFGIHHYNGFISTIDKRVRGWKEVDLVRRMRNTFTKTPLSYNPSDSDNVKLREKIMVHFALDGGSDRGAGPIPTPIDSVLKPLFLGCRDYVRNASSVGRNEL